MGLDIMVLTDNIEEIHATDDYLDESNDYFNKHSLSRTFCNFMSRQHVVNGIPELDQIGDLTGIDISPIYDMEKYWDELSAEHQLSFAEDENEKIKIQNKIDTDRESLRGNIDKVLNTISRLIDSLSQINDLHKKLNDFGTSTLNYDFYFTDFSIDKGDGYIDNNFGQDLRNFKRFIEFAKSKNSTTVYFNYG